MAEIEKRNGKYRARYTDPLGRRRSETFLRKADAERFIREVRVEADRGNWVDPRGAEVTLNAWVDEFLLLARRLADNVVRQLRFTDEGVRRYDADMRTHLAVEQSDVSVDVALEGESAIDRLRGLMAADRAVERWLSEAVTEARRVGESWSAIGDALGVTRQAAWKLYNRELIAALDETRDRSGLTEDAAMELAIDELKEVRAHRRRR